MMNVLLESSIHLDDERRVEYSFPGNIRRILFDMVTVDDQKGLPMQHGQLAV
jgi:hypothetical protein